MYKRNDNDNLVDAADKVKTVPVLKYDVVPRCNYSQLYTILCNYTIGRTIAIVFHTHGRTKLNADKKGMIKNFS